MSVRSLACLSQNANEIDWSLTILNALLEVVHPLFQVAASGMDAMITVVVNVIVATDMVGVVVVVGGVVCSKRNLIF